MAAKHWLAALPILATGGIAALWFGRSRQERALAPLWRELHLPATDGIFDPAMVEDLPDPARRYLRHAIKPGTPIARSVRLSMHGAFRLRPGADLVPMRAEQILSPPYGLIWKARVGSGLIWFRGYDRYAGGQGDMRWWLYGTLPLVNASGTDVSRSAAGRVAGESLLVPAAWLPQFGAEWEIVNDSTARIRFVVGDEPSMVTVTVDPSGRVKRVSLPRWRDDVGDGKPGYDRFDVDQMTEERDFGGYTIPTQFCAGWRLGDPDEFRFFYATIDAASFQPPGSAARESPAL